MAVVSTALNVAGPKILGKATDVVVAGVSSEQGIDFGALPPPSCRSRFVYAVGAGLGVLIAYVLAGVVQRRLRPGRWPRRSQRFLDYIDHQPAATC